MVREKNIELCPLCGSKLDGGYLAFASGVAWSDKKLVIGHLKGSSVENLSLAGGLGLAYIMLWLIDAENAS